MDYFHDLQEIIANPRLMAYPEVETPFSLSPSKSEFVYPINLKSPTLEYLSPNSYVRFKYLRTLFAAFQCSSHGFCINQERIPTANEIFGLVVVR